MGLGLHLDVTSQGTLLRVLSAQKLVKMPGVEKILERAYKVKDDLDKFP